MPDHFAARLQRLASRQGFCLTRRQVLAAGATQKWLRVRLETGRWKRVHPGVYVTFTGPIPWRTRAWAAVLYAGEGAVLGFEAAGYDAGIVRSPPATVDVWVPLARNARSRPGVRVHRRTCLPRDGMQTDPPRTRTDPTVLDLTSRCLDADAVVGVLTEGLRRGASADGVLALLAERPRQRWRRLLLEVLADCEVGVESPLEWHYHRDVVQRHGLPRFELQSRHRVGGRWIRADSRCARFGVRTELDGALAHPGGRTDSDAWRDNDAVIDTDEITLRYRWAHVVGRPCHTAAQVVRALRRGGWTGQPRACGPECQLIQQLASAA